MNSSGTQTQTFTIADIRKVVENFAADLSMMAQFTGIHSREYVLKTVFDLNFFAECRYLLQVMVMLKDKHGNKINAAIYKTSESAIGWTCERPGNNRWPRTPDGALLVIATMTKAWNDKTGAEKEAFCKENRLNWVWVSTTQDITLVGLRPSAGQKYSSSGYGWERTNYGI